MARLLSVTDPLSPSLLTEVAACLDEGGVIAVGTESFYALAAKFDRESAIERVAAMKGERAGKPLLVLIGDRSHLRLLTPPPPPFAEALMIRFWPGPLTVVLPALPLLSTILTAGTGTIGIRQPGEPKLLTLLHDIGPVTGTSANRTGAPPLQTAQEVEREFGHEIEMILDTGPAPGGLPSTVLSLVGPIRILRQGAVDREALRVALAETGFPLDETIDEVRS
ncbi:MAG: threonylcarbamoyl-AMP synthase [Nitrospirae bacterium]|nr:MAG: threonylcarbamoyl-AMP synthase [Nitrospirota bacterium]